jgi:hypothetical protein
VGKRVSPEQRVIEAARRLAACVQKERDVKSRINWDACEQASDADYDETTGDEIVPYREPCCFTVEDNDVDGKKPRAEWCPVCETNWTLRGEYGRLRIKRAGLIRGLVNAVERMDTTATGKAETNNG